MSQAAAQQPSRKKAVISLLVLLALTCIIVFTFKDHWAEITAALAQLSVWQVLAVLAVGISYPLLEGGVAWVIVPMIKGNVVTVDVVRSPEQGTCAAVCRSSPCGRGWMWAGAAPLATWSRWVPVLFRCSCTTCTGPGCRLAPAQG